MTDDLVSLLDQGSSAAWRLEAWIAAATKSRTLAAADPAVVVSVTPRISELERQSLTREFPPAVLFREPYWMQALQHIECVPIVYNEGRLD